MAKLDLVARYHGWRGNSGAVGDHPVLDMHDPIPQNRLRSLRREHGLTLQQVANATGVHCSTIHQLETSGREVTLGTALRLAEFYGLPVDNIWQPLYDQICVLPQTILPRLKKT